ncbi:mitochondrion protein [Coccidioides immitis H538.4]|uniref:Probable endonuclease LCL3 n=1 Tax=Coccidioides immitis H538.4 TaxID=396776 RepID=A0A0J8UV58_COCIT|nr:mitochondrion protein [Coccidioides immitis H538.4]
MRWLFWASPPQDDSNNNNGAASQVKCRNNENVDVPAPSNAAPPSDRTISKVQSSSRDWNSIVNATDWKQFTEPRTIIPTALVTGGILLCVHIHRKYLRRIPEAGHISPSFFRRRSLLGKVTSVGDGDNFRMYHTPGGKLGGWEWWRKVPTGKNELKNRTIHVRLAGVDAPELPHFGRPAQPFSHEAHSWLTRYILGRRVRAHLYRPDQYGRVVATVYVRRWLFFRQDVGLQMLKHGLATVYEAKTGVEFGGVELERQYREAEACAKKKGKGMWKGLKGGKKGEWESPREYKTRMAAEEEQKKNARGGTRKK